MHDTSARPSLALQRALALSMGLCVVLMAGLAYLLIERKQQAPGALLEVAKASKEVQAAAIAALVAGADGVWDAHPDADVARIMQPDVKQRDFRGVPVSSNAFGLREESFAAQKPKGVTRIVLLGDSFVFGYKVAAQDRLGVFLKRFLAEQGVEGELECLHLAVSSWNILSETSYVRRQLDQLEPDLVIQVIISNDLDDTRGPRGFGAIGNYSPQQRRNAGGTLSNLTPLGLWPQRVQGYLLYHLDHQSRVRYAAAAAQIKRLAEAVESQGGKYVLLSSWETYSPMVAGHLAAQLEPRQVAYVSQTFASDERYCVEPGDRHWNRAGHERVAQMLYGFIQQNDLLPALQPRAWSTATAALAELHGIGAGEATHIAEYEALLLEKASEQISSSIDFERLTRLGAKQVHAGVHEAGQVAPFASLILANPQASQLVLRGTRYAGPALKHGRAQVSIEGIPVGSFELWDAAQEASIEANYPIPAELQARAFLTITIESDDYLYTDLANGHCSAFRLNQIELK